MIHALLRSVGWQASAARRVQQRGASQIHALWSGQKTFQIEISFDQLMKIVSVTTAQQKDTETPTVNDIVDLYGQNYAEPKSWALLDIGFSQEVSSEDQSESSRVFIGGNMTELRVIALPY